MVQGRKHAAAVVALALCCALTACGGSSGVSAGSYVKSICQAIGPFEKDVQARSSALNLSAIKNASQGKQALRTFLGAVVSDTDTAVSKLKAAGTPKVSNGKQISGAVVNAFAQLKRALASAANQANSLPTSSPAAFKSAANALGTSVRSSMTNIGSGLSGLKSPALENAAKKEPACQSLGA